MGRLAIAAGTTILGSPFGRGARRVEVGVDGRPIAVLDAGGHVVLQRHGLDAYTLPHAIDHAANMRALAELGCDRVLALGSVGGTSARTPVGTFMAPDDFIALGPSPTTHGGYEAHRVAGFDADWRRQVLDAWGGASNVPLVDGGVYWQSGGPRFETAAEIRMLSRFAQVVGMTLASECVVACELDLPYAAVCVVDNLANGVGGRPLTVGEFEAGKEANRDRLIAALDGVVPDLAGNGT
jgi:5'-methylthioinosine phosphorylase